MGRGTGEDYFAPRVIVFVFPNTKIGESTSSVGGSGSTGGPMAYYKVHSFIILRCYCKIIFLTSGTLGDGHTCTFVDVASDGQNTMQYGMQTEFPHQCFILSAHVQFWRSCAAHMGHGLCFQTSLHCPQKTWSLGIGNCTTTSWSIKRYPLPSQKLLLHFLANHGWQQVWWRESKPVQLCSIRAFFTVKKRSQRQRGDKDE